MKIFAFNTLIKAKIANLTYIKQGIPIQLLKATSSNRELLKIKF